MLQSVLRKQVLQGNYIVPIPIVTMCVAENRHSAPLHDSFVVSWISMNDGRVNIPKKTIASPSTPKNTNVQT